MNTTEYQNEIHENDPTKDLLHQIERINTGINICYGVIGFLVLAMTIILMLTFL